MSFFWSIIVFATMSFPVPMPESDTPLVYETYGPEVVLHLRPALISGNSVKIPYSIPYPGYIEFHLFDPEGTKIWIGTGVREKGDHVQAIRRDKLNDGATYSFDIYYKGKKYSGKFINS